MATVTQTTDEHVGARGGTRAAQLTGIRSRLLTALIFEVVALLVSAVGVLMMVGATIGMATEDNFTGVTLFFGYLADGIPAAFLAAGAAFTVPVGIRTWKLLDAADRGDVAALKRLSSSGWAVVGIFASYVVPGILLLRANRAIRDLDG
jgi:hypothetical protein